MLAVACPNSFLLPAHVVSSKQAGQLQVAIDQMLALEKKCRQSADSDSTVRVANAIVQAAYEVGDLAVLNAQLALLAKRRGQFKRVILSIVNTAIGIVDKLPNKSDQLTLIATLRAITEGKMFVENERARLTRQLARMKESEGDLKAASKLMQELQIETYNTMDKREKTDYILEQMRLCLETGDFARAQIISRKISERLLNHADFQHEKERYYRMMIRYYSHTNEFLDMCRSYLSIYNTASSKWRRVCELCERFVFVDMCVLRSQSRRGQVGAGVAEGGAVCGVGALWQRAERSVGAYCGGQGA